MFTSVLSTNAYKSGHYKQFIDVCWSFTNESCHYNHFIDVYWCFLMFAYHLLIKAVTTNTLLMFIDVSLPFVNKSGHYKQFIDVTWWFTNKSDHYNQFTMFLDDLLMKPLTYLSFALWPALNLMWSMFFVDVYQHLLIKVVTTNHLLMIAYHLLMTCPKLWCD